MAITVRQAGPEDAETLARLANELDLDQGGEGSNFTPEKVLRDGFGERPGYAAFLAEDGGVATGYAMAADLYNTDLAAWGLWLCDLYVRPGQRRKGAAQALMAAVAAYGLGRGAVTIWWGVYDWNDDAIAFYRAAGAEKPDAHVMELNEGNMKAIASKLPDPKVDR